MNTRYRPHLLSENAREWLKAAVAGIALVLFFVVLMHAEIFIPQGFR